MSTATKPMQLKAMFRPSLSMQEITDISKSIQAAIHNASYQDQEHKMRLIKLYKKIDLLRHKIEQEITSPAYVAETPKEAALSYAEKLALVDDFDVEAFTREMEEAQKKIEQL